MEEEMGEEKKKEENIDRSKIGILLCDNDSNPNNNSFDAFSLLSNCSYHVTAVKSARQVINVLNAEGPNIDIILFEVDLPTKKGLKLLKYIMRDQESQRIPVIMMSTQDEVSLVVKCLRLGAADYLVKPLRKNELLNLWTHMWRRRRMLGLTEKNIVTYGIDLAASDPSDANTNSTALLSDDTDKSRRSDNPQTSLVGQQEDDLQSNKASSEPMPMDPPDCRPCVPGISDRRTGHVASLLKKSELKIGECSAFFTYVNSITASNNCQPAAGVDGKLIAKNIYEEVMAVDVDDDAVQVQPFRAEDKSEAWQDHVSNGNMRYENKDTWENNSHGEDLPSSASVLDSTSMERSCTPPVSMRFIPNTSSDEDLSQPHMQPRNGPPFDVSGLAGHGSYPYYMPGMMNQFMMPSAHMMPHYNHLPHCPSHLPGMTPFNYYPMGMCVQQGQLPSNQQPPPHGNSPSSEAGLSKVDRREAALMKFRQKREKRCFDNKIRYVNRKKLTERRPRVRGQFIRKVNGVTVDLNGVPSPIDLDEEDDDDIDPTSRDSSPEDNIL